MEEGGIDLHAELAERIIADINPTQEQRPYLKALLEACLKPRPGIIPIRTVRKPNEDEKK